MLIEELQTSLQSIYEIETSHRVSNFITSNEQIKSILFATEGATNETVFFRQEDGYLDIAVFFDDDILRKIDSQSSSGSVSVENINNYCYVLEGISHFLYLIHYGRYDRSYNLLEMELQAEVDKFIMLQSLVDIQGINNDKREVHNMVFDDVFYRTGLSREEKSRYKDANFYAGKYCHSLLKDYIAHRNLADMNRQLRRFYRLPLQEKIRQINQLH